MVFAFSVTLSPVSWKIHFKLSAWKWIWLDWKSEPFWPPPAVTDNLTASIVLDLGNYGRILNLSGCLTRPLSCGWKTAAPLLSLCDFLSGSSQFLELYAIYTQVRPPLKYLCRENIGSERGHWLGVSIPELPELQSFLKIPSWYGASHLRFLDLHFSDCYLKGLS